jgi:hypothetical protein
MEASPSSRSSSFVPIAGSTELLIFIPGYSLLEGLSMPSLYFHDEESPTTLEILKTSRSSTSLATTGSGPDTPEASQRSKVPWGATPLFSALRSHAEILRSRLEPRLFLVNPSKSDREVHEIDLGDSAENDRVLPKVGTSSDSNNAERKAYPPKAIFPEPTTSNPSGDFPCGHVPASDQNTAVVGLFAVDAESQEPDSGHPESAVRRTDRHASAGSSARSCEPVVRMGGQKDRRQEEQRRWRVRVGACISCVSAIDRYH